MWNAVKIVLGAGFAGLLIFTVATRDETAQTAVLAVICVLAIYWWQRERHTANERLETRLKIIEHRLTSVELASRNRTFGDR